MPISIAPTNLLPLGDQPTRVSVRVNRDLLKSIDPSMDPWLKEIASAGSNGKGELPLTRWPAL